MKRPCEDSSSADSSAEEPIDVGSERLLSGHVNASFITRGSPTTTTQTMARKKRRGIIEKRRRDRINSSLSELRRLVPSALEKQGSAKLEKAEILQMTVDHLKLLQAAGGKGYLDAHAVALDFLSLGFRECVTEVSRYLSAVEDASDPLRSRLLAHLASCAAQRDAAAATLAVSLPHPHPLHPLQPPHPFPHPFHPHNWAAIAFRPPPYGLPLSPEGGGGGGGGGGAPQRPVERTSSLADSSSSSSSSSMVPPAPLLSFPLALHAGFPVLPPSSFTCTTSSPISSSSTSSISISSSSSSSTSSQAPRRPYRPWGTEVGAF